MLTAAYLSLGSNMGNREENLRNAIARLRAHGKVEAVSSFYETEPVDVLDQPWFINCAVKLMTEESPQQLLASVLSIEQNLGRVRTRDKGPRTIDIDILLFGDLVVDEPRLKVPHPGLAQRGFVLEPLSEIAPDVHVPVSGQTIRELRDALKPAPGAVRRML